MSFYSQNLLTKHEIKIGTGNSKLGVNDIRNFKDLNFGNDLIEERQELILLTHESNYSIENAICVPQPFDGPVERAKNRKILKTNKRGDKISGMIK